MILVLVLHVDGILLTGNDSDDLSKREMASQARNTESWHDVSIYEVGKENLYCEVIEECLESGNANPWTLLGAKSCILKLLIASH